MVWGVGGTDKSQDPQLDACGSRRGAHGNHDTVLLLCMFEMFSKFLKTTQNVINALSHQPPLKKNKNKNHKPVAWIRCPPDTFCPTGQIRPVDEFGITRYSKTFESLDNIS